MDRTFLLDAIVFVVVMLGLPYVAIRAFHIHPGQLLPGVAPLDEGLPLSALGGTS